MCRKTKKVQHTYDKEVRNIIQQQRDAAVAHSAITQMQQLGASQALSGEHYMERRGRTSGTMADVVEIGSAQQVERQSKKSFIKGVNYANLKHYALDHLSSFNINGPPSSQWKEHPLIPEHLMRPSHLR